MKIIILANEDIASNYALNLLIPALGDHDVTVFLSSKVGASQNDVPQLETLKFFEQSLFNQLMSPLINAVHRESACKTFEQLNRYLSQPIEVLNKINSSEGVECIRQHQPDLMISIRYGNILKEDVIKIPHLGVLNLHSGLLPEYRGVMATFWAMLNDEKEVGTTLHYIEDSSIDTGRIVSNSRFNVDKSKSYLWHVLQLYISGVELILNAICHIEKDGQVDARPQPGSGQYFSFPKLDDLLEFEKKGLSLINASEIVSFIRTHYY